jgi:hypothetical protein
MPSLRDILHKREDLTEKSSASKSAPQNPPLSPPPPEITFLRSDTFGQEVITPPAHPHDEHTRNTSETPESPRLGSSNSRRSFFFQRSNSSRSLSSPSPPRPRGERRLSNLLHRRSRSNSQESSANIPEGLPQIEDEQGVDKQEREAQWEKRATVLVQRNPHFGQSPPPSVGDLSLPGGGQGRSRSSSHSRLGDQQDDVSWQCGRRTAGECCRVADSWWTDQYPRGYSAA